MTLTRPAVTTLFLIGLLPGACRPAPQPPLPLDLTPAPVDAAAAAETTTIVDAAGLEESLKAAGLTLILDSELPTHYLPGMARIYAVVDSAERVELYGYATEAEAIKAAAGISRDGMTMADPQDPGERIAVKWPAPPHVYRRGKMLVIYAGSDAAALEALTAGLGALIAGAD